MDSFQEYILGLWHSALPTQLARAICVAAVFELLAYLAQRWLRGALRPALERGAAAEPARRVRRNRLLIAVPANLARGVLYTVALLMVLRIFRLDTRAELLPIGLALLVLVAVAARNPLRDFCRGYLILFDNDMDIGEQVTIAGFTGVVQEMTLRNTRLRLDNGEMVTIPNGRIGEITNHTRQVRPGAGIGGV